MICWTGKQYSPNIEGKAAGCKRVRGVLCTKKAEARGSAARIQEEDFQLNLCFGIRAQGFTCQNSFQNILGILKYQWKTLKTAALTALPGPISHGNLGKQNRRKGCT
jgi:hypothetical protein